MIKECDKGAGILILKFEEYMRACYNHLTSEQVPGSPHYCPVNVLAVEETKKKIDIILKETLDNNFITKSEHSAMDPEDKGPERFFCNLKVHKEHEIYKSPPERPITSQSGTFCEGIATFVEIHIKHIATKHDSYLQDTPDFVRED